MISDGHPRGWDHLALPLGWAANPLTGSDAAVAAGWYGDVPVVYNGVEHGDDEDDAMDAALASAIVSSAPAPTNGAPANGVGGAAAVAGDDFYVLRRFLR